MDVDFVVDTARALYGADWQTALARGLGPLHPAGAREAIDDRLVRRWASRERPVPEWVGEALVQLLEDGADLFAERAEDLQRRAESLRLELGLDHGPGLRM